MLSIFFFYLTQILSLILKISEDDAMLVFSTCVNTFNFNEKSTVEEIDKAFSAVATITSCKTLAQKAVEATYISTQNTSHKDICFRYDRIFTNSKAGLSTIRNAYKQLTIRSS